MGDWMTKYEEQRKERVARGKETLLRQCDELDKLGVSFVLMHYEGQGDSGAVESAAAYTGQYEGSGGGDYDCGGEQIAAVKLEGKFDEDLFIQAADQVTDTHPGWENNAGAYGDVVLDVKNRKVTIYHNDRYEDVNFSSTEL